MSTKLEERCAVVATSAVQAVDRKCASRRIGDQMPDGTIYAGISPETNTPMYAMPNDARSKMRWEQAIRHCGNRRAHGHEDWRLPTVAELNVLFENREAMGGFDTSGAGYWSSEHLYDSAWIQTFSDGSLSNYLKGADYRVRCIRS